MSIEVREESSTDLVEYARIPIAFDVHSILDVGDQRSDRTGFVLVERRLETSFVKDYDAVEGESPSHWARRFDVSNWVIFTARADGRRVGGAVVAWNTPRLDMLDGRTDLAVLWDIRVSPDARRHGVGSALFAAAEAWAVARGCRQLKVETQNVNVPACRFYSARGCVLETVHRAAYPEFPHEIQLLWYKDLHVGG